MNLFRHNDNYIILPDQEALFSLPSVLFGHIEKGSLTPFGWRWKKRAVVLNPSGHLLIYKYFLKDVGAGRPFVGRVIHLDAAQHIQVRMDKDICRIKIHDHTRKRTELRVKGTKARLWAAKVFMYEASLNDCKRRSTAAEIEWPIERPLKVLDSKTSTSSICDLVRATNVNHMEEFSKITIASVSSESFPDYTDSDISHRKTQLSAQILDVEQIRKIETFAARRKDSESNSIENISVQNATTIYGKFTHKKFETNRLLKRSKSAPEFTVEAEFFIAKGTNKSVSLGRLNSLLISRQDRLRKHFQNMIESRFYDNLAECTLNYSPLSIQKLHTQAGSLRMSQIHIPYNTLLIKDETQAQRQQRLGSLLPLSININCKLREELKNGDKHENETVYHF